MNDRGSRHAGRERSGSHRIATWHTAEIILTIEATVPLCGRAGEHGIELIRRLVRVSSIKKSTYSVMVTPGASE